MDAAQKKAGEVEQKLAEGRSVLLTYRRQNTNVYYNDFTDMVLDAAKASESLTDSLRRLSLEVALEPQKYEDYKMDLVDIHGIEVLYEDGVLTITLPFLAPHRKGGYTDYLYKPLHLALQHWCVRQAEEGLAIPAYKKCTVCFLHLYDETLPLVRVRDHDNMEEKHVMDVVSNFFLVSDSGLYADTYHMTRMAADDRTKIYVMDSVVFPEWIAQTWQERVSK